MATDNISIMSLNEKRLIAVKLHKQFAHASSDKLAKLIDSAGIEDAEIRNLFGEITEDCDICKCYKKSKPRPVVGFSLAHDFNEVIIHHCSTAVEIMEFTIVRQTSWSFIAGTRSCFLIPASLQMTSGNDSFLPLV